MDEASGAVGVSIVLSSPTSQIVRVSYGAYNITAVSPLDYTYVTGQAVFLPNQVEAIFSVPIIDDTLVEPTERFKVQLFSPSNAVIGAGIQTISIFDNDSGEDTYGPVEVVAAYAGDGRDPGQFGKIVHDSAGNLHAAYFEAENRDLKYAFGLRNPSTGGVEWFIQKVDESGDVGRYCDIAVTLNDAPIISYHDQTNGRLKVAWDQNRDGDFEQDGAVFGVNDQTNFREIGVVDGTSPNAGTNTSIAVDSLNHFHISYKDEFRGKLRYAVYNGVGWSLEDVDATSSAQVGRYSSIVVDNSYVISAGFPVPVIFYQDEVNLRLRVAVRSSVTGWTLVAPLDATGAVGFHIDSVINPADGRISISHQDPILLDQYHSALKLQRYSLTQNPASEQVYSCTTVLGNPCDPSALNGDWGYYSSITLDGMARPVIAHYEATTGDLILDRRTTDSLNTLIPQTSTYLQKFRPQTVGDVGLFTSSDHHVYLDPATFNPIDTIRTSFYDNSRKGSKMLTLEDGAAAAESAGFIDGAKVGQWSALAIDPNGTTALAYYDDTDGALYITRRTGAYPNAWAAPFLVDDSAASRSRAGDAVRNPDSKLDWNNFAQTGQRVSMEYDSTGLAHALYHDKLRNELNYTVIDFATSSTQRVRVDEGRMRGQFSNLAKIPATDLFGMVYYQENNPDPATADPLGNGPALRFAIDTGTTFTLEVVDRAGDVGRYCSLAFDNAGVAHAAYFDATNGNLKYARRDAPGSWSTFTVDASQNIDGLYTSIAIDPTSNLPVIAYYDLIDASLKYAKATGLGWSIQTVDDLGDVGSYAKLRIDPVGKVVYLVYHDALFESLKIAAKGLLATSWALVDTIDDGGVGREPSFAIDAQGKIRVSYYDEEHGDLLYRQTSRAPFSGVKRDVWERYE